MTEHHVMNLARAYLALGAERDALREALAWYADEAQWEADESEMGPFWYFGQGSSREIPWEIARKALERHP